MNPLDTVKAIKEVNALLEGSEYNLQTELHSGGLLTISLYVNTGTGWRFRRSRTVEVEPT